MSYKCGSVENCITSTEYIMKVYFSEMGCSQSMNVNTPECPDVLTYPNAIQLLIIDHNVYLIILNNCL